MLLAFLHDHFGRDRVQDLLASPAATFDEAFKTVLGVGMGDLSREWKERLDREGRLERQDKER
ncbi:MAG: hypothetical protein U0Q16_08930 [Bryobacteraceae bacterium]